MSRFWDMGYDGRREPIVTKHFTNVWDAIEDTPALAENMKLRSSLMLALRDHIAREGLTPRN